jgi:hypothetical protein
MREEEVVIIDDIPEKDYDKMVDEAIRYAVISSPFTCNRMSKDELKTRIINIGKGKVAEHLKRFVFERSKIPADWEVCTTPFYQVDKRDYLLLQYTWDTKNNFLYHLGNLMHKELYTNLPALVPNRNSYDQWSKRDERLVKGSLGNNFVFTYLKNLDCYQKGRNFFDFEWSKDQEEWLLTLCEKYKGNVRDDPPFTEDRFWEEYLKRGNDIKCRLKHYPFLVITGYANLNHWDCFVDTGAGIKSHCGGVLTTVINNKMCAVNRLPSFLSLFPQLAEFSIGRRKQRLESEQESERKPEPEPATLFS